MNSVIYKNLSLYFFTLCTFLISSSLTLAQAKKISFGGYEVASDVQVSQGQLNIYSNPDYGEGIAFEVERDDQVEVF